MEKKFGIGDCVIVKSRGDRGKFSYYLSGSVGTIVNASDSGLSYALDISDPVDAHPDERQKGGLEFNWLIESGRFGPDDLEYYEYADVPVDDAFEEVFT